MKSNNVFHVVVFCFVALICNSTHAQHSEFAGNTKLVDFKTQNVVSIHGNAYLKNVEAAGLTMHGTLEFADLKIGLHVDNGFFNVIGPVNNSIGLECNCKVKIVGPVEMSKVYAKAIDIVGQTELANVHVEKIKIVGSTDILDSNVQNVDVIGDLNIIKSSIGEINANATRMRVRSTVVQDIFVASNNDDKKQVVILNGSTIVKNNIVFEKVGGIVQADDAAVINGKVVGGAIIRNKK